MQLCGEKRNDLLSYKFQTLLLSLLKLMKVRINPDSWTYSAVDLSWGMIYYFRVGVKLDVTRRGRKTGGCRGVISLDVENSGRYSLGY